MARILVGVSGGIAAYKALEFVRLAIKSGHSVRVLQTESSLNFVGKASFEGITGAPVLISEFEKDPARGAFPDQPTPDHEPIGHLELVANADLYIIAPATANTIAKLASGMADGMLGAAALAASCPVAVAPAMNGAMYTNAATQANLNTLRERGVTIIEPGEGSLASKGEWGVGRLREPSEILGACDQLLGRRGGKPLDGLKVLITAGGTREPIDSVRYIGNRSSGRMGYALAHEARARGADVRVISANVSLQQEEGIEYIDANTAASMLAACEVEFERCDVLFMTAAVADFRPVQAVDQKIKKTDRETLPLELESTVDILGEMSSRRTDGQLLVGFAAEHGDGALEYGREKLTRKKLDLIVVNDISRPGIGFDAEDNEVTILSSNSERLVPRANKSAIAAAIVDCVATELASRAPIGEKNAR